MMKETDKDTAEETENDCMIYLLKNSPGSIAGKERIGRDGKILLF